MRDLMCDSRQESSSETGLFKTGPLQAIAALEQ